MLLGPSSNMRLGVRSLVYAVLCANIYAFVICLSGPKLKLTSQNSCLKAIHCVLSLEKLFFPEGQLQGSRGQLTDIKIVKTFLFH